MTDWRYWITYEGKIQAANEDEARTAAMIDLDERGTAWAVVEVEEIDQGERVYA